MTPQSRHASDRWGFWLPVTDEESARKAVKLVTIPLTVFVGFSLITIYEIYRERYGLIILTSIAFLCLFLMVQAPLAKRFDFLPLAYLSSLCGAGFSVWFITQQSLSEPSFAYFLAPLGAIIGTGCLVSLCCSIRGWLWLRRNDKI